MRAESWSLTSKVDEENRQYSDEKMERRTRKNKLFLNAAAGSTLQYNNLLPFKMVLALG